MFRKCVVLCGLILASLAVGNPYAAPPEGPFVTDWLVCGPFPGLGSMPEFYRDNLTEIGGEQDAVPTEGLTLHSKTFQTDIEEWYGTVTWKRHRTEENGYVDYGKILDTETGALTGPWRKIAYAFCTIESPKAQRVVFEVRTNDALQMWVNHKQITYNRLFRGGWRSGGVDILVVDLEQGSNAVLIKLADYRYGGWGFAMRWMPAEESIFVNEKDVLLPHLRVGEKLAGWAYLSLVNSTEETLKDVEITVKENDLFLPTTTKAYVLKPRWDSRAAFRIETKRAVAKRDSSARIALVIRSGDEVHRVTLTPEVRDREQYFAKTYHSEVDGSVQPYSLLMPSDYDANKAFALMIVLHGAHVKECIQCYKPKEGMIIASAYGRGNTGYREIGTNDVMTVLRLVRDQYHIDENRIYLAGHSMGGHGTWYLGMHYPDIWAALNPMSGYGDYRIWKNTLQADWQAPLYEDRSAIFFIENALHLPIFDVHGVKDEDVTVTQSRRIMAELEKLGYEAVYDEHPDRPHWWGMDFPNAIAFLKEKVRDSHPKEVILKINRLKYNRSNWVQIDEIERLPRMAKVHARIEPGNRIVVEAQNVFQYTLLLDEHLVDLKQPVTIQTNGLSNYAGTLPPSGMISLRTQPDAKGYEVVEGPRKGLIKTRTLFGPILDAYSTPFIYVYGTSGTAEDTEINRRMARQDALDWRTWANGNSVIKRDKEVTSEDIETCNLILYGGPETNAITARVHDRLPIRIEHGAIVAGDRRYVGADIGLKMIFPNPLNPNRYVLINAGVTSGAITEIYNIGDPLYDPIPDYVIFDRKDVAYDRHYFLEAGYFDRNWEFVSGEW